MCTVQYSVQNSAQRCTVNYSVQNSAQMCKVECRDFLTKHDASGGGEWTVIM